MPLLLYKHYFLHEDPSVRIKRGLMVPGVYALVCVSTKERYVGSSENLWRRWNKHRSMLSIGNHAKSIQKLWETYNCSEFYFEVLELCDESKLLEREQYHINCTGQGYSLNSRKQAKPGFTKGHTSETKQRLSELNTGKRMSKEAIAKTVAAHTGAKRSKETSTNISNGIKLAWERKVKEGTTGSTWETRRKNGTVKMSVQARHNVRVSQQKRGMNQAWTKIEVLGEKVLTELLNKYTNRIDKCRVNGVKPIAKQFGMTVKKLNVLILNVKKVGILDKSGRVILRPFVRV